MRPTGSRGSVNTLIWAGLLALIVTGLRAEKPPAGEADESLPDSVFMGVVLNTRIMDEVIPVLDYRAGQWVAGDPESPRVMNKLPVIEMRKTIRHSDNFIAVSDLETTRMSTEAFQQARRVSSAQAAIASTRARMDNMMARREEQAARLTGAEAPETVEVFSNSIDSLSQQISQAQTEIESFEETMGNVDGGAFGTAQTFDQLRIEFTVEPRETIRSCYLVTRILYHSNPQLSPNLDPEEVRGAYHIKEIGDLPAGEPTRVGFNLTGFTAGPRIIESNYHFFSGDDEIPSDFSSQRIPVTEEEAFDFVYADYVAQAGDRDRLPALFKRLPVDPLLSMASKDELRAADVQYTVTPMGFAEAIVVSGVDGAAAEALRAFIRERARFFPALEDGLPVERSRSHPLAELVAW